MVARCASARCTGQPRASRRVAVKAVLAAEAAAGLHTFEGHNGFADAVFTIKRDLVDFLIAGARRGQAGRRLRRPGQGQHAAQPLRHPRRTCSNTRSTAPHKQGMFLPGTHIPIHAPERIAADRPDYVLVLPWNLRTEISAQLSYVRDWGGRLVFPIPALDVEG